MSALIAVKPVRKVRHQRDIERGVERVGGIGSARGAGDSASTELPGIPSPMLLPNEAIALKQHNDAMTVYVNAQPFGMYEDEYAQIATLHGFQNYEPPRRKDLAGKWLDICYEDVYSEAQHHWKMAEYINTVMDESTDIAGNRIVNLSFVTPHGVFYVNTEDSGAESQTSDFLAR
jgi:hypothetical protein